MYKVIAAIRASLFDHANKDTKVCSLLLVNLWNLLPTAYQSITWLLFFIKFPANTTTKCEPRRLFRQLGYLCPVLLRFRSGPAVAGLVR